MPQGKPPFARLVKSGDAVEDGRLACAVRADQRGDLALPCIERQIFHGGEPAEPHRQMLDAKQCLVAFRHQPCPWPTRSAPMRLRSFRNTDGARVEISPRGRQIIISTMAKPKISIRYWVGSNVGPNTDLRKPRSPMISVPPITARAAPPT